MEDGGWGVKWGFWGGEGRDGISSSFYSFLLQASLLPYLIIFSAYDTKKFQIPKTLVQTQSGDMIRYGVTVSRIGVLGVVGWVGRMRMGGGGRRRREREVGGGEGEVS